MKVGARLLVDGRPFTVEMVLAVGPNIAKYIQTWLGVRGPRGAYRSLQRRVDGSWFMLDQAGNGGEVARVLLVGG